MGEVVIGHEGIVTVDPIQVTNCDSRKVNLQAKDKYYKCVQSSYIYMYMIFVTVKVKILTFPQ